MQKAIEVAEAALAKASQRRHPPSPRPMRPACRPPATRWRPPRRRWTGSTSAGEELEQRGADPRHSGSEATSLPGLQVVLARHSQGVGHFAAAFPAVDRVEDIRRRLDGYLFSKLLLPWAATLWSSRSGEAVAVRSIGLDLPAAPWHARTPAPGGPPNHPGTPRGYMAEILPASRAAGAWKRALPRPGRQETVRNHFSEWPASAWHMAPIQLYFGQKNSQNGEAGFNEGIERKVSCPGFSSKDYFEYPKPAQNTTIMPCPLSFYLKQRVKSNKSAVVNEIWPEKCVAR